MWEVNLRVTEEFQASTDGQEDYLSILVCVDDTGQKGADGLGPAGLCLFLWGSREEEHRGQEQIVDTHYKLLSHSRNTNYHKLN